MMKFVFWGVFAAGFIGCSAFGIGSVLQRAGGNWGSPYMIAGCVAGVAIVALGIAFATGFRSALLPNDTSMVVALAVLVAAKVGVSFVQATSSALAR